MERRVKEEIEAREKVWTERKGTESALSAIHQQRYEIFCHMIMKTKEISATLRSSPKRKTSLRAHLEKYKNTKKLREGKHRSAHYLNQSSGKKTDSQAVLVLTIRQAVTVGLRKAGGQCAWVRCPASQVRSQHLGGLLLGSMDEKDQ